MIGGVAIAAVLIWEERGRPGIPDLGTGSPTARRDFSEHPSLLLDSVLAKVVILAAAVHG
jgi:hypothetical protein